MADPLIATLAELAEVDARRAHLRAQIRESPLGRYEAGRIAARKAVDEAAAVAASVRLGVLFRAATDGDAARIHEEADDLADDEVAELMIAAETLAEELAKVQAERGRR